MNNLQVFADSYFSTDRIRAKIIPGLDAASLFYEQLLREKCEVRFSIAELEMEIAAVGAMHIVAGAEDKLEPFREIRAAFFVGSVAELKEELERLGAGILQPPQRGPFGMFMIAKHPGGNIVEYADRIVEDL